MAWSEPLVYLRRMRRAMEIESLFLGIDTLEPQSRRSPSRQERGKHTAHIDLDGRRAQSTATRGVRRASGLAMLENPIVPEGGSVAALELPGFGMRVKEEVWEHPRVVRRVSEV